MISPEDFYDAPSRSMLEAYKKDEILEIATHYGVTISSTDVRAKDKMIATLVEGLVKKGVLPGSISPPEGTENLPGALMGASSSTGPGLSFSEQKEILMLQMQYERMKQETQRSQLGAVPPQGAFDLRESQRLIPHFSEKDVETFFALFEHVAVSRNWSDENRVLLLVFPHREGLKGLQCIESE